MTKRDGAERSERGFVLVFVLWVLILVSMVAATQAARTRDAALAVVTREEKSRLRAIADAGIPLAVNVLLAQPPGAVEETRFACRLDDVTLWVEIEDEHGKVDVNVVSPGTVASLLQATGVETTRAVRMADAVADFVDADDLTRLNGAEASAYAQAGLVRGPRNGPLIALGELAHVIGWQEQDIAALSPHLTVHSGRRAVDPVVASAPVQTVLGQLVLGSEATQETASRLYTIRVHARSGDAQTGRAAVVALTRRPAPSYQVLAWNGRGSGSPPGSGETPVPC